MMRSEQEVRAMLAKVQTFGSCAVIVILEWVLHLRDDGFVLLNGAPTHNEINDLTHGAGALESAIVNGGAK